MDQRVHVIEKDLVMDHNKDVLKTNCLKQLFSKNIMSNPMLVTLCIIISSERGSLLQV